MATICKSPKPLSLGGNVSQNWKEFEEQLVWFLEGTESVSKSDMVKTILCGERSKRGIQNTTVEREGDSQKFNKVIEVFRKYCSPRKHILNERYTFWTLQQEVDESVDGYLTRIKLKLDTREYPPEVCQDLARDKFVFGLTNDRLK